MTNELKAHLIDNYEGAEITTIFLHHIKKDIAYNLLTLIELVPAEQEVSQLISDEKNHHLDRENKELKGLTVYIGRSVGVPVAEALDNYINFFNGFEIIQGKGLQRKILPFDGNSLSSEPPAMFPLVLPSAEQNNLTQVFPKRNSDFRLWMLLDKNKSWRENYDEKELKRIISNAAELSKKYIHTDLEKFDEHLGNAYLFGCNPILRDADFSLIDHNTRLLVQFKERSGKSIIGSKLVLEEKRGSNVGFYIEKIIEQRRLIIDLPYFPDTLIKSIIHADGYLLEKDHSTWANYEMQMHIHETQVNTTINVNGKSKEIKSAKYTKQPSVKVAGYDFSGARYFVDRMNGRKHEVAAVTKEFMFFEGSPADKAQASQIVHDLLSKANFRVMLLDPYFGAIDFEYAIGVSNMSIEVQVISSAFFLHEKVIKERLETNAHALNSVLDQYTAAFSRHQIRIRVLPGNKRSPLHDRYIVVDDDAYLLGSSFNEFGSRATTLIKVPTPKYLIDRAISWWNTGTVTLDDFIDNLDVPNE
jgi:hypothetical protein